MTGKGLGVLAVITVVALGATAYVMKTTPSIIVADHRGETVFPKLQTHGADIASIELKDGDRSIVVQRKGDGFIEPATNFPVKLEPVRDLVATAAALRFEEAKTSDPERYKDLGLAAPGSGVDGGREVTIKDKDGGVFASLLIGNREMAVGGPQGGSYAKIGDSAQTWLLRGEVKLPGMKSEWFDNVLAKVDHAKVLRVTISGGDKDTIAATSPEAGKDLELANIPEGRQADTGKVSRMSGLIESLEFQDLRKASAPPAASTRSLVAETRDGLKLTIVPIGEINESWVRISVESTDPASAEQAKAIAEKVDGREFRIAGYQAEMLGWTMNDATEEQKKS
jgi:hypothetical protein